MLKPRLPGLRLATCLLQSLEIVFIFANSAGPDEMMHFATFHLGLHCLPKDPIMGFPVYNG